MAPDVGICDSPMIPVRWTTACFLLPKRRMRRLPARGFSLLELLTVLALVGILAGLSAAALGGLKKRATFVASSGDLLEALRQTRAEGFSRGAPCVFVVDTAGQRWWS